MPACEHDFDTIRCVCRKCGVARFTFESLMMSDAKHGIQSIGASKLRVEVERLREIVAWYGDRENHKRTGQSQSRVEQGENGRIFRRGRWSPIELDGGHRAREALGEND